MNEATARRPCRCRGLPDAFLPTGIAPSPSPGPRRAGWLGWSDSRRPRPGPTWPSRPPADPGGSVATLPSRRRAAPLMVLLGCRAAAAGAPHDARCWRSGGPGAVGAPANSAASGEEPLRRYCANTVERGTRSTRWRRRCLGWVPAMAATRPAIGAGGRRGRAGSRLHHLCLFPHGQLPYTTFVFRWRRRRSPCPLATAQGGARRPSCSAADRHRHWVGRTRPLPRRGEGQPGMAAMATWRRCDPRDPARGVLLLDAPPRCEG